MTDADYLEYVDEQREFVDKYGDKTPEGKFIKSITYAFIEYLAYCNSIEVEK